MKDLSAQISSLLLKKKAVEVSLDSPFTLSSGLRSPIYCDHRLLISCPESRAMVVAGFQQLITEHQLEFDIIGGTATAAIPWAAFLAHELKKPLVYIRPKPKSHGTGRQVEGTMPKGAKVLIVEDLISTAGSAVQSAAACEREFSAEISGILAIFIYGFSAANERLAQAGIPWFTLSSFPQLSQQLTLSTAEKSSLELFVADPTGWSAARQG